MSQKFLMPCECGQQIAIERRQAGSSVTCVCGRVLDVPTIREIVHLAPAETTEQPLPPIWGLRQGLLFLGLIVAVPAFSCAAYLYRHLSTIAETNFNFDEAFKQATPMQTWDLWKLYEQGLPKTPSPNIVAILNGIETQTQWMNLSIFIGIVGVLVAVSAIFVRRGGKQSARRTAAK